MIVGKVNKIAGVENKVRIERFHVLKLPAQIRLTHPQADMQIAELNTGLADQTICKVGNWHIEMLNCHPSGFNLPSITEGSKSTYQRQLEHSATIKFHSLRDIFE